MTEVDIMNIVIAEKSQTFSLFDIYHKNDSNSATTVLSENVINTAFVRMNCYVIAMMFIHLSVWDGHAL